MCIGRLLERYTRDIIVAAEREIVWLGTGVGNRLFNAFFVNLAFCIMIFSYSKNILK
jgi:hypothetical protein